MDEENSGEKGEIFDITFVSCLISLSLQNVGQIFGNFTVLVIVCSVIIICHFAKMEMFKNDFKMIYASIKS